MTTLESCADRPHICVCICTFKRGRVLAELLAALERQRTADAFTYSVVVVDNDHLRSAEEMVKIISSTSALPIRYCVEPRQNIALARNMAVAQARGRDFIAFIDDDEVPGDEWLLTLLRTHQRYGVDGVLGPVKPRFDQPPPKWVVSGKFCERPTYPTGFVIDWKKGRTGNVLVSSRIFAELDEPFRPQFLTGEDQDFFRRMIENGFVFVWCHEAVAYETVPPARWRRTFMLRRALFRGAVSLAHPSIGAGAIAKSAVAAGVYVLLLPFSLLFGQRGLMTCLIKLFDHSGRLLASVGIQPVKEPYVTD